jgi:hypothetical protein
MFKVIVVDHRSGNAFSFRHRTLACNGQCFFWFKMTPTPPEASHNNCGINISRGVVGSFADNTILDNNVGGNGGNVCGGSLTSYAFQ